MSILEYCNSIVKGMAETNLRKLGTDKRLTIILSEYDYERLTNVSDFLDEKISVLARNFIILSLDDAEKVLKDLNDFKV